MAAARLHIASGDPAAGALQLALEFVYAYHEPDIIRVISAWKANRLQRRLYEKSRR